LAASIGTHALAVGLFGHIVLVEKSGPPPSSASLIISLEEALQVPPSQAADTPQTLPLVLEDGPEPADQIALHTPSPPAAARTGVALGHFQDWQASPGPVSPGMNFFGIKPNGDAIVFVIDISGSMLEKAGRQSRLEVAFSEIRSAISLLQSHQSFNIVLFADRVAVFEHSAVPATPENCRRAFAFLDRDHELGGGTDLEKGLAAALHMKPDALIVLTDGQANTPDEVILRRASELRSRGGDHLQIHTIGFFLRPRSGPEKLLIRLSAENKGTYTRWVRTEGGVQGETLVKPALRP
jgi:hypothetical protein